MSNNYDENDAAEYADAVYPDLVEVEIRGPVYFWRVNLDDLVAAPLRVNELPADEQRKLLLQLQPLQTALMAVALLAAPAEAAAPKKREPDEMLTPEDVAKILGKNVRWIYAHWKSLPFAKKLSHKSLRFSKTGLEKWLATR